jgi:hypothetical protein
LEDTLSSGLVLEASLKHCLLCNLLPLVKFAETFPEAASPQLRHLDLESLLLRIGALEVDLALSQGEGCRGVEICFARLVLPASREELARNGEGTLDMGLGGAAGLDNSRGFDEMRRLGTDSKVGRGREATDLLCSNPAVAESRHAAPVEPVRLGERGK